jgi:hypothetical protein
MTTFSDWGTELEQDLKFEALNNKAAIAQKMLGFVDDYRLHRLGVSEKRFEELKPSIIAAIRSDIPLNEQQLAILVPPPEEQDRLSKVKGADDQPLVDNNVKQLWKVLEAEAAAAETNKKASEVAEAEALAQSRLRSFEDFSLAKQSSVGGQTLLKRAKEQQAEADKLRANLSDEQAKSDAAVRRATITFEQGTLGGTPSTTARPGDVRRFVPPPQLEQAPGFQGGPTTAATRPDLQFQMEEAFKGPGLPSEIPPAPTTAAPAASAATVAAPAVDTTASPGVPGDVTDPLQVKWDRFQQGALYQSLVAGGMAREDADRYLESVRSAAEGAGMSMDEWLARDQQQGAGGTSGVTFGPKGIETGQKWAPWTRDPAEAPGLAALKAEAAAAGMPGAMQLAYQQQSPETVWSRLGLAGEIARDPFTGDPISTAQLAPLAQRGIQDWFSRTVEPGYAFATARAAQQRAAGLPNELELGFENWARQAQERGRISPEEARLGQRAILDILQNPRDVLDPYAQETLGFLSETGGLDDYRNPRVIEALAAPMLQRISPIYRPGAKRNIQQEIANLQTLDPTSKMTSFFTGTPVPRPGYEPETFEALAGGMPLARGLPLGFNQFS